MKTSDFFHRRQYSTSFGSWLAVSRLDLPVSHMHSCTYMDSLSNWLYFSDAVSGILFSLFHMRGGCFTVRWFLLQFLLWLCPKGKALILWLLLCSQFSAFLLDRVHLYVCKGVQMLCTEWRDILSVFTWRSSVPTGRGQIRRVLRLSVSSLVLNQWMMFPIW